MRSAPGQRCRTARRLANLHNSSLERRLTAGTFSCIKPRPRGLVAAGASWARQDRGVEAAVEVRSGLSLLLFGFAVATLQFALLPAIAGESIVRIPPGRPSPVPEPPAARAPDPAPAPTAPAPPPPAPQRPAPATPPAPAPQASLGPGNYGAIAYSPSNGALGWGYDYPSREDAEKIALTNCRKYAADCVVPVWFRNACGAVATGPSGYGSGWGVSRELAEQYALESCRKHSQGCAVQRWVCSTR